MAIQNPDHLIEQAERLVRSSSGPVRQVDIRRAMSSAYYAIFHVVVAGAADQVVGAAHRRSAVYGLVYRSVDHRSLRALCNFVKSGRNVEPYTPYLPESGLGIELTGFASALLELQDARVKADYDPLLRFTLADARASIGTARAAGTRLAAADSTSRRIFYMLLLFPPKR